MPEDEEKDTTSDAARGAAKIIITVSGEKVDLSGAQGEDTGAAFTTAFSTSFDS